MGGQTARQLRRRHGGRPPPSLGLTARAFRHNGTAQADTPRFNVKGKAALAQDPRGTKREDPETGKKFYDLNKDPIVSPYTGKSYPRSYFEQNVARKAGAEPDEEQEDEELEVEEVVAAPDEPEVISLEDADAEEAGETEGEEEIPDVEDVEDVEDIGEDDEDAFLEEDEEEDENLDFDVGGDER